MRYVVTDKSDLKSIIKLDSELFQIQDLDILLERILLEARKVVHADAGSIYIKEDDKLAIKFAHNDTLSKDLPPGQKLIFSVFSVAISEKTISGYAALTRQLVNVPDAYNINPDAPYSFSTTYDTLSGYKTISTLAVPLVTADGNLLGVLQVFNAKDDDGNTIPFSADDEFLITHFASSASLALHRAQMTRSMILRMIKLSELRDPKETGTHVNRVAGYAIEIYDRWAQVHGIPKSERERFKDTLRIASMLHDVGKVAISDIILKKPSSFSPEERKIMQNHVLYGAKLFVDTQTPMDSLAKDIALTHHENWDGTGYPGWIDPSTGQPLKTDEVGNILGRKEEEIPLIGRIVAIADVYDALRSKRSYKEPWPEEQVLAEIRKLSGIKFDPELVDIFFEILPNIRQVQALYPEQDESALDIEAIR
jgi:HD-GYP domain-containing protein (c-di-GMP phosphodiesterase class II)